MQLTVEERETLSQGSPIVTVIDGREYLLVSRDEFERHRSDLLTDWHPSTMQRQMAEAMREDWADPAMSVYDDE